MVYAKLSGAEDDYRLLDGHVNLCVLICFVPLPVPAPSESHEGIESHEKNRNLNHERRANSLSKQTSSPRHPTEPCPSRIDPLRHSPAEYHPFRGKKTDEGNQEATSIMTNIFLSVTGLTREYKCNVNTSTNYVYNADSEARAT